MHLVQSHVQHILIDDWKTEARITSGITYFMNDDVLKIILIFCIFGSVEIRSVGPSIADPVSGRAE